jgi:hypothetical protein
LDEEYPDIENSTVSDLDICLYNEENDHIHYIELKQDLENGRKDKAQDQIEKAYTFWNDMNYTVSATEAYLEEAELRHHPILENKEDVKADIDEVIDHVKEPDYSENSVIEKEDKEAFVETDLPKGFGRRFKPEFEPVRQLEERFQEVPDKETVRIAFYSYEHDQVMTKRLEPCRLFSM